MAQTGYTPLLIYSSSTVSQAPAAGNLTNSTLGSELAINITDGKLFYKDNANAVQVIAWKTTPTTAGGTGLTSYTAGDLLYYASGTAFTKLAIGATGRWLGSSGTAPQWNAPAALTKTDDTNVTLTLGGSASTALLNAASITVGWTGTLATTRGGTGLSSFTANGILYASSTSALATSANLNYTSGNLGLNATPAAWSWPDTSTGVLQLQAYAALSGYNATTYLSNNWYYNAGEKFIANGYAMRYEQTTGKHVWYVSNASNAGGAGAAVTWTQVMQTHASTGVSIGNTTDPGAGNLNVNGPTLKVGTTSLYNSTANIGTFSWSSATNVGGEGAYVFVNTSTSANSDPNPILAIHKGSTTTSSSARFIQFFANGAAQAMGGIVGNGATNVQFVSLSDEREKENIQPVTGALDRLMQIQVCSFDRKGGGDHVKAGFIAQNVLPVYPEYVVENAANADDDPRYGITGGMSAGYVAELTAAIQEQQAMINDLKQKLEQYIAKN